MTAIAAICRPGEIVLAADSRRLSLTNSAQTMVCKIQATGQATVHITSSPSGGEIYIDAKFFGNVPSDIALAAGEHVVRVTLGGKEWTRTVQITGGEIQLRAELP